MNYIFYSNCEPELWPEAVLKHPKAWEQKICFSGGFASVHVVQYCSLLGHKTLIKALYKGNIPWSLGLLTGVKLFIMLQRPIVWEKLVHSVSYKFFSVVQGNFVCQWPKNIWHCIRLWQAKCLLQWNLKLVPNEWTLLKYQLMAL